MTQSYDLFVQSRVKPGEDIMATMTPFRARLLHAAIGLSGEAGELLYAVEPISRDGNPLMLLDEDNIKEELGDLHFYLSDLGALLEEKDFIRYEVGPDVYDRLFSHNTAIRARLSVSVIATEAANVLDVVKKHVIYNKPLDTETLIDHASKLRAAMYFLSSVFDWKPADLMDANREKLEKRYPTGYTDAAAAARADKEQGQ